MRRFLAPGQNSMANASDRDFAPLNLATVRGLNDKLYEKRKVAALEVEKYLVHVTCVCIISMH